MAGVRYPAIIPGPGIYVVGVDITPGRYVCKESGTWIRFPGRGGAPFSGTTTAVLVADDDVALQTDDVWHLVEPGRLASGASADGAPRWPVVDPALSSSMALMARRLDGIEIPRHWFARAVGPLLGGWSIVEFAILAFISLWERRVPTADDLVLATLCATAIVLLVTKGDGQRRIADRIKTGYRGGQVRAAIKAGRIITARDIAPAHAALLARAQAAIRQVTGSDVNKAGLLDSLDNALTLEGQEWEIAGILARLSRWEAEREATPSADPDVQDALGSEAAALAEVLASVTGRVEALETYAKHVAEADRVHRAQEQIQAIAQRSERYTELLAETARDYLAIAQIKRLDEYAQALGQTLADRLARAAEIDFAGD